MSNQREYEQENEKIQNALQRERAIENNLCQKIGELEAKKYTLERYLFEDNFAGEGVYSVELPITGQPTHPETEASIPLTTSYFAKSFEKAVEFVSIGFDERIQPENLSSIDEAPTTKRNDNTLQIATTEIERQFQDPIASTDGYPDSVRGMQNFGNPTSEIMKTESTAKKTDSQGIMLKKKDNGIASPNSFKEYFETAGQSKSFEMFKKLPATNTDAHQTQHEGFAENNGYERTKFSKTMIENINPSSGLSKPSQKHGLPIAKLHEKLNKIAGTKASGSTLTRAKSQEIANDTGFEARLEAELQELESELCKKSTKPLTETEKNFANMLTSMGSQPTLKKNPLPKGSLTRTVRHGYTKSLIPLETDPIYDGTGIYTLPKNQELMSGIDAIRTGKRSQSMGRIDVSRKNDTELHRLQNKMNLNKITENTRDRLFGKESFKESCDDIDQVIQKVILNSTTCFNI